MRPLVSRIRIQFYLTPTCKLLMYNTCTYIHIIHTSIQQLTDIDHIIIGLCHHGCTRRCRIALAASFGRSFVRIYFITATVLMALSQSWPEKRRRTRPIIICAKSCEGAQYGATYQASMSDFRSDRGGGGAPQLCM